MHLNTTTTQSNHTSPKTLKPKNDKQLAIRIPSASLKRFQDIAEERAQPLSEVIRRLLKKWANGEITI